MSIGFINTDTNEWANTDSVNWIGLAPPGIGFVSTAVNAWTDTNADIWVRPSGPDIRFLDLDESFELGDRPVSDLSIAAPDGLELLNEISLDRHSLPAVLSNTQMADTVLMDADVCFTNTGANEWASTDSDTWAGDIKSLPEIAFLVLDESLGMNVVALLDADIGFTDTGANVWTDTGAVAWIGTIDVLPGIGFIVINETFAMEDGSNLTLDLGIAVSDGFDAIDVTDILRRSFLTAQSSAGFNIISWLSANSWFTDTTANAWTDTDAVEWAGTIETLPETGFMVLDETFGVGSVVSSNLDLGVASADGLALLDDTGVLRHSFFTALSSVLMQGGANLDLDIIIRDGIQIQVAALMDDAIIDMESAIITDQISFDKIPDPDIRHPFRVKACAVNLAMIIEAIGLVEALEEAELDQLEFMTNGDAYWYEQSSVVSPSSNTGLAWRSGAIDNSQLTFLNVSVNGPGTLQFLWKVSSESGYDKLVVSLDGVQDQEISGEVDWTMVSITIPAGSHEVMWAYGKDISASQGSDCGWVDNIEMVR